MSALLKVFIGLLVLVFLVQFIEMAPEGTADNEDDESNKFVKELTDQFKNAFSDENVKKFIDNASSALADGAKTLETHMKDWKEKLDKIGEKKE